MDLAFSTKLEKKPQSMRRIVTIREMKPEMLCLFFRIYQLTLLIAMKPKMRVSKVDRAPATVCKV